MGALRDLDRGGHWALVGRRGEMAAGNGAAMRAAPLVFVTDPTSEEGKLCVRDVSRITHHSDEAYAGALAVVLAVHFALVGRLKGDGDLISRVCRHLPDTLVRERLQVLDEEDSDRTIGELAETHGCTGYVVESVPLALVAAQRVRSTGFKTMIEDLVRCGGDADTNASMAGQVAGCLLGSQELGVDCPTDWQIGQRLEELATAIAKISVRGGE